MSLRQAAGRGAPKAAATLAAVLGITLAVSNGYTVRAGDTLSGIAARHGTSVRALASANGIADIHRIFAGDQLRLPGGGSGGGAAATAGSLVVTPGQTLSGIAARHGVSVGSIAAVNDLASIHQIYAGQRLSLPGSSGDGAPTRQRTVHVVARGETLSGIAAKYRVRVSAILRWNDLGDADYVRSGQRLRIRVAPGDTTPSVPAAASAPSRDDIGELLTATARRYGWNPAFVKALAWQESGWNNTAVSNVGAVGVMQVLPSTGEWVSTYLVGRDLDLDDPADNIEAGVAFLDYLHRLTDGDTERILGGYYQGLRSIRNNGVYPSTRRYIANVLALRERFGI